MRSPRSCALAGCLVVHLLSGLGARGQTAGPLLPQGPKLLGTGAISNINGGASQGRSVALSADGNTAIVGGDSDNDSTGAAWVFTRSNGVWSQQQKLTTSDVVGQFGISVGISGDGNTAIVGCNCQANAVWLFNRNSGVWGPAQKLSPTGAVHFPQIGASVALSGDGNTALIGGPGDADGVGAAWVFTRAVSGWTQQGSKLIGTGAIGLAAQGTAVALSADGNTAIVGGYGDNFVGGSSIGAAWVFSRSQGAWEGGTKLVGNTTDGLRQGLAVAISADGNTALVAGPYGVGGAWVFVRNNTGGWTQQAGPLAGPTAGKFSGDGTSVALNADGNVAVVGGPGDNDAWLFTRANGMWTERQGLTRPEVASTFSQLGFSAAISADTTTFLLGSPGDNPQNVARVGAAWAFDAPAASVAATAGTPQMAFLGAGFPTNMQTTVLNTLGYPAPGVTVTFSAPASGASGTFSGGSTVAAAMTNAAGIATAPAFTANQARGPYNVTASVAGVVSGADFALTNAPLAVSIILQTSPPNLFLSLDGGKFVPSPLFQLLVPGSSHTIATQSPQTGASGTRYSFVSWSDGQPLSHSITVPIVDTTYTATFAPAPVISAVVNAATNAPPAAAGGGLAQGSFVTIYGSNLGPAAGVSPTTLPLQPSLGGVTVTFTWANGSSQTGYPVYVGSTQINVILPSSVPVGRVNLTVNYNGAASLPTLIQVVNSAFGIFTANYGSGPAAVIDLNTPDPVVTAANPAHPGDFLALFGTGLGPVTVPDNQAPGPVSPPGISVSVTVAGQTIVSLYAGRSPEFPAEDQINFQLPASGMIAPGCSVPIVVQVNGVASNSATMAIANGGSSCSASP